MNPWILAFGIACLVAAWLLERWERRSQARTVAAYREQLDRWEGE